jgi:hypothetical protein
MLRIRSIVTIHSLTLTYVLLLASQSLAQTRQETSQDYITTRGTEWTLGSASVEITIALRNGVLVTTGFHCCSRKTL